MKFDFILPDSIKEVYRSKPIQGDKYLVVDFLYVDVGNSKPSVVHPAKIIDLENLKELILHWWENRSVTKILNNRIEVKLFPVVEA